MIDRWARSVPLDTLMQVLNQAQVPASRIYSAEDMFSDPQFLAREMFLQARLPDGKPLLLEYASQPDQQSRQFNELWKRNMDAIGLRIEDGYWDHRDAAVVFEHIDELLDLGDELGLVHAPCPHGLQHPVERSVTPEFVIDVDRRQNVEEPGTIGGL